MFGPAQERVQKECGAAPFGAVQLVMEMQMSSPQLGSARPNRPMDKKKTHLFLLQSVQEFVPLQLWTHPNSYKLCEGDRLLVGRQN